jgi:hypothetical protein
LRHSNGNLQRSQIFGSKPFFVLALIAEPPLKDSCPEPNHYRTAVSRNPAVTKPTNWAARSDNSRKE